MGLLGSMWDLPGPGIYPFSLNWQVDSLAPPSENLQRPGWGLGCDQLVHNALVEGERTGKCHRGYHYQFLSSRGLGGYVLGHQVL